MCVKYVYIYICRETYNIDTDLFEERESFQMATFMSIFPCFWAKSFVFLIYQNLWG